MNKILLTLAALTACAASTTALAQPMREGPGMDRPHMMDRRGHKVWVPAHRMNGHRVPGHYVWR